METTKLQAKAHEMGFVKETFRRTEDARKRLEDAIANYTATLISDIADNQDEMDASEMESLRRAGDADLQDVMRAALKRV